MHQVTLLFLLRHDSILLAMKKRGFGQGLWNGVGGKVEPNETVTEAAIRECQEEIGVTPRSIRQAGRLAFHMRSTPEIEHDIHIFSCTDWEGEPAETGEMRPQWFAFDSIPYDEMWSDDALWLPYLLEGRHFTGIVEAGQDSEIISAQIRPDAVQ